MSKSKDVRDNTGVFKKGRQAEQAAQPGTMLTEADIAKEAERRMNEPPSKEEIEAAMPPIRTFQVQRTTLEADGTPTVTTVEGHVFEHDHGDLYFYVYSVVPNPQVGGFMPAQKIRFAVSAATWTDLWEVQQGGN
jgi:hypothetical protein